MKVFKSALLVFWFVSFFKINLKCFCTIQAAQFKHFCSNYTSILAKSIQTVQATQPFVINELHELLIQVKLRQMFV